MVDADGMHNDVHILDIEGDEKKKRLSTADVKYLMPSIHCNIMSILAYKPGLEPEPGPSLP